MLILGSLPLIRGEDFFLWKTLMLSRLIVALIVLFMVVNRSKRLCDRKRLPTSVIDYSKNSKSFSLNGSQMGL